MLVTKRAIDLTSEEADRCRELTYGDEGWMREDFEGAVQRESSGRHYRYTQVIMYKDQHGSIKGWCLLQPVPYHARYMAYFFVDEACRGQGIGSKLITEANTWGKYKLDVSVDETNHGFFKKHDQLHEGFI